MVRKVYIDGKSQNNYILDKCRIQYEYRTYNHLLRLIIFIYHLVMPQTNITDEKHAMSRIAQARFGVNSVNCYRPYLCSYVSLDHQSDHKLQNTLININADFHNNNEIKCIVSVVLINNNKVYVQICYKLKLT